MSYEPRGKVKALLDAMRASDRPVWNSTDVAKVLETSTNAVPAFVDPSIRHGVLFRKLENGRSQYSLKPFAPAATTAPAIAPAAAVVPAAPRETTATGWTPPQMACTRPGAGTIAPAAAPVVVTSREDAERAAQETIEHFHRAPQITQVPPVEPAEPALTIELDAPLDEQQQEEPEPLSWSIWDDGDLDLFGLVELENGGYRIQAKDVARLRRMLAWLPA